MTGTVKAAFQACESSCLQDAQRLPSQYHAIAGQHLIMIKIILAGQHLIIIITMIINNSRATRVTVHALPDIKLLP